jgi:prevent-host-death family protein
MVMTETKKAKRQPFLVRETPAVYAEGPETSAGPSRTISAGDFKARCLAIMDEVQDGGGEYIITKRGTPVAKLVPVRIERRALLGSMHGTVNVIGDIIGPLNEPWDALEGWDDES